MSIDNEHRTSPANQTSSTQPTETHGHRPFDEVIAQPATQQQEPEREQPKDRRVGRGVLIGAGALAVVVGAGLFLINQKPGSDHKADAATPPKDDHETSQTPASSPSASPEVTPITGTNEQGNNTASSLEISASLSPEQIGKQLIERDWNAWRNAGETANNYNKAFDDPAGFDAFSQSVAKKETTVFTDALFAPDWQSRADLEDYAANYMQGNNALAIRSWIATYKEPQHFQWTATVDSVDLEAKDQGTNSETLDIKFTQHTNAADFPNNGAISEELSQFDGIKEEMVVTLQNLDGTMKITGINQKDIQ